MKSFSYLVVLVALFGEIAAFAAASAAGRTCASNLCMSTIAVFGGTGQTGRECVYQALKANHKVVVLARNPSKMLIPPGSGGELAEQPLVDKNLFVMQGDVTDQAAVDAVFTAHPEISGVIVALGGRTKDVGPTLLTDGTNCIVNAMKNKSSAKRIAALTVIGTGDSEKSAPLKFKVLMYTMMRSIYADKNRQEKIFTEPTGAGHDLEYCIVRPGGLGVGAPTGVITPNLDGKGGSIHRADVASFLLGAVTDTNFPFIRKTPALSSLSGTGWVKEDKPGFDKPAEL